MALLTDDIHKWSILWAENTNFKTPHLSYNMDVEFPAARSVSLPRYMLQVSGLPTLPFAMTYTTRSQHSYKGMYGKY